MSILIQIIHIFLKGANAKAKANAAQGLPELIEIAAGKKFTENYKEKHTIDAMYGWYRYESRFALPVFNEVGEIERYNVFNVIMVIRHAKDGKMYLYDIMNKKKKRAPFSSPKTLLSKNPFLSYDCTPIVAKKVNKKKRIYFGNHFTIK